MSYISKETIVDSVTGNVIDIDNRIFEDCVNFQLKELKRIAAEKILEVAPEYKQRNAALGLLSEEETEELKNNIQNIRNQSNIMEDQIKAITWDGTEETRSTACDAVQSIFWT